MELTNYNDQNNNQSQKITDYILREEASNYGLIDIQFYGNDVYFSFERSGRPLIYKWNCEFQIIEEVSEAPCSKDEEYVDGETISLLLRLIDSMMIRRIDVKELIMGVEMYVPSAFQHLRIIRNYITEGYVIQGVEDEDEIIPGCLSQIVDSIVTHRIMDINVK